MDIPKIVLEGNGFKEFNILQKLVLEKPVFDKSIVISAPTASGKTIVAELTALNSVLNRKKKAIYTCPLKALASEHFHEFKRKYSQKHEIKMILATGDLDSSSDYLQKFDVIFCTNEKLDSLIRHHANWLKSVGTLIVDEVHELDSNRGPTIEMVITKLRNIIPTMQVVALSATIPNSKELAEWLKAELVESNFRPIPVKEGIYFGNSIQFNDESIEEIEGEEEAIPNLIENTIAKEKQALVFANTRKRSESIARELGKVVGKKLKAREKIGLEKLSQKILRALEIPTEQCTKLAACIENGTAFHHAGLVSRQRKLVEDAFRAGQIKVLSATPTLAMGINLPAYRVIIPSIYRYTMNGTEEISVREYKQMVGRSGRPKFDTKGEAVLLARDESEAQELVEGFIQGKIEEVQSRMGILPVLRMHLLALIAEGDVRDLNSMEEFFAKTFYAHQFKNLDEVFALLNDILEELVVYEFIASDGKNFSPTTLGKRVAELYLDPLSAWQMIQGFKREKLNDFGALFVLANTFEFAPYLSIPKRMESAMWQEMQERSKDLPISIEKEMVVDTHLNEKFYSAIMLEEWIQETPEQTMAKEFNIQPGILRQKLQIADWICYSAVELCKLTNNARHIPKFTEIRKRLETGIKAEIIPLCELRGIGRVRGRKLFQAGITGIGDVKRVEIEKLGAILGEGIALQLKRHLGEKVDVKKSAPKKQLTLFDSEKKI